MDDVTGKYTSWQIVLLERYKKGDRGTGATAKREPGSRPA